MTTMIQLADLRELPEGKPVAAQVAGMELLIVRDGGRVLAFAGRCPHQGTSLAEGTFEHGVLTCPGHGWRFQCDSGARLDAPGSGLKAFATVIHDHTVRVDEDELLAWQKQCPLGASSRAPVAVCRRLSQLPKPKGVPLLGNLLQVQLDALHSDLENWARQFGSLYTFSIGRKPVVVVAEPWDILDILRNRPETYRRLSTIQEVNRELGVGGVFSAEGKDWRRQRSLVTAGLDVDHVRRFFPTLIQLTERLRKRWADPETRPIDVQQDLVRYTVDVTTNFVFDCDMNMLERGEEAFQKHLRQILPAINRRVNAPFRYWRYFKLPVDRATDRAVEALKDVCHQFVARARERLGDADDHRQGPRNLLESLLMAHDTDHGRLSEDEIFGNTITMLLAGEDTTANTLAWMIHFLARHPQAQQRIRAEVDAVMATDSGLWDSRQIDRLHYLDAVTSETLRLKPAAPLLFLEANSNVTLGGVEIPPGTALMLLMRFPCRQEKNFTDAETFCPERWLLPRDASRYPAHNRAVWMPFGAGPRFCPGRHLAWLEVKTAMAMICRHFDLGLCEHAGPVSERFVFTMMPGHSKIDLRPRV